jgi:DNA ligase-1
MPPACLFPWPGKIAPEYALGADLNIGGAVVSSALCEVAGASRAQLREMYNSLGDLGDVAQVGSCALCVMM